MFRSTHLLAAALALAAPPAFAQDPVADGARIAVIGGCHDCHTAGYNESGGQVDPATALKGTPLGYQGPWGTSYAKNLLLTAAQFDEAGWVEYLKTFKTLPPMPFYNVHAFTDAEMKALYAYIKSLGEPGAPAPEALPPGGAPQTPFIVMAPPNMPG
jgi:cytochrome c1